MTRHTRLWHVVLLGAVALGLGAAGWANGGDRRGQRHTRAAAEQVTLDISRIFIEFNSTANDLGFHVFLDGEDWRKLKIVNPLGRTIFEVEGRGPFGERGLTELFFEGAEPSLFEVPREELLADFPEGEYRFIGRDVDGAALEATATLTHDVPDGPVIVSPQAGDVVNPNNTEIRWQSVTSPPGIQIAGYQVIVGTFQVTLPASSDRVTVPSQFMLSLEPGPQAFEVLAIEEGGNQTITEGSFTVP